MMLSVLGVMSGFLLILSTLGGAVGGFMRMRRKLSHVDNPDWCARAVFDIP